MKYDYRCRDCTEIFEEDYPIGEPPPVIQCPVCKSGRTQKMIVCPAIYINWKDVRSSGDVSGVTPKFLPPAKRQPKETAEDFGGR